MQFDPQQLLYRENRPYILIYWYTLYPVQLITLATEISWFLASSMDPSKNEKGDFLLIDGKTFKMNGMKETYAAQDKNYDIFWPFSKFNITRFVFRCFLISWREAMATSFDVCFFRVSKILVTSSTIKKHTWPWAGGSSISQEGQIISDIFSTHQFLPKD